MSDEPQFNGQDAAGDEQLQPDQGLASPTTDSTGRAGAADAEPVVPAGRNADEAPQKPAASPDEEGYTVGEKIASLLDVVLNNPNPPADAGARAVLAAFRTARRFGLTRAAERIFPPLEDEEAWHSWLGLAVGVCLNLPSDGQELDVELCRVEGARVLAELFA